MMNVLIPVRLVLVKNQQDAANGSYRRLTVSLYSLKQWAVKENVLMKKVLLSLVCLFGCLISSDLHLRAGEQAYVGFVCQFKDEENFLNKSLDLSYLFVDLRKNQVAFGGDKVWLPKENASIKKIAVGYKLRWKQPLKWSNGVWDVRSFSARITGGGEMQLFLDRNCTGHCDHWEVKLVCKPL